MREREEKKNPNILHPSLLLYIHPEYHMSLAHCAVAEKSFLALKALFACQPQLINQVITEGDFENYAPINYFLAMLVSKIDFRLDQYLPPDHVIDHGIIEEYERSKKEPAQKIIDDNDNIKCITDFLLGTIHILRKHLYCTKLNLIS